MIYMASYKIQALDNYLSSLSQQKREVPLENVTQLQCTCIQKKDNAHNIYEYKNVQPVNKPKKVMTSCTIWNLHKEDKQ